MLRCDIHIHSHRSFVGDANMTLENIAGRAAELSIDIAAVTDHLMKPEDIEDLRRTRDDILSFRGKNHKTRILFGVEVCEVSPDGSTLLTQELMDDLRFEVVIGGVHETHMPNGAALSDMAAMQHRHQLMMMENPLIEILVHPWWLDMVEFARLGMAFPEDMSFIPAEMTAQLAHASRRTGTCIEISTMSGLCNRDTSEIFRRDLCEYYRTLYREGALFAVGTDTHELSELSTYAHAAELIRTVGIDEDRLWQPKSRTVEGKR